jgi:hypothetical protein
MENRRNIPEMSAKHSPASTPKNYSPFWPIALVFLTMTAIQRVYIFNTWQTRKTLLATQSEIQSLLPRAKMLNEMVESIGRDLVALSDGKNEAAKIVSEFEIKLNGQKPTVAAKK